MHLCASCCTGAPKGRRQAPSLSVSGCRSVGHNGEELPRERGLRGQNNGAAVQSRAAEGMTSRSVRAAATTPAPRPSTGKYNGKWEVKSVRKWRGIPSML